MSKLNCKQGDWAIVTKHKGFVGVIVHLLELHEPDENNPDSVWKIETPLYRRDGKHIRFVQDKFLTPLNDLQETEKEEFLNDMYVLEKLVDSSTQAKLQNIRNLQARIDAWKKRNQGK